MIKKCYLIDFENIAKIDKINVDKFSADDLIIVFYNDSQFKNMQDFFKYGTKVNIKTIKLIRQGKNALDFQISNTLGYLVSLYKNKFNYYIVSEDLGMDIFIENTFLIHKIHHPRSNIKIKRINVIK